MSTTEHTNKQRLLIHGTVQGVGYRIHAQRIAQQLMLLGWVRNRPDGTVEALMSGSQKACEHFLQWAHQGPSAARVTHIQSFDLNTEEQNDLARCTSFTIRRES